MDPNMLIIIIIIIALLIMAYIYNKKDDKDKIKDKLESMMSRLSEENPNQSLVISGIEQEYKDFIKDKFGDKGLQFYTSNLKPVTCAIPTDFSLVKLDDLYRNRATSPEYERLRLCGYIHNVSLLMLSLVIWIFKPDLSFDDFKAAITELMKQDLLNDAPKPAVKGYYSRYGRFYPQYY
jgi:hypothetical protein